MKTLVFAALLTLSAADIARGGPVDAPVMEIVTFRLAEGVSQKDFLTSAAKTEVLLRARGDVVRRWLTVDDTGLWTDLVEWTSQSAALKTAAEVVEHPDFQPFMAMIDPKTVSMRHAGILWRMD